MSINQLENKMNTFQPAKKIPSYDTDEIIQMGFVSSEEEYFEVLWEFITEGRLIELTASQYEGLKQHYDFSQVNAVFDGRHYTAQKNS